MALLLYRWWGWMGPNLAPMFPWARRRLHLPDARGDRLLRLEGVRRPASVPFGNGFNTAEFGGIHNDRVGAPRLTLVNYATNKGLKVDLDVHNYGSGNLIGSAQTPNAAFADLWGKLWHFEFNPNVIFGLMNEPHSSVR